MKKLQKLLAMMLTVVMCVGTLADTGFTVFAADDAGEDAVSEAPAEEPTDGEEEAVPGEDAVSEDAVSENGTGEDAFPEEGETSGDGDEEAPEETDTEDPTLYKIWVGGVQVTSTNMNDIGGALGTDYKVSYNPYINTLTFQNVSGFTGEYNNSAIYAEQSITIKGDIYAYNPAQYGILVKGSTSNLTIDGDVTIVGCSKVAIYSYGNITVTKNASVIAGGNTDGIYTSGSLTTEGTISAASTKYAINAIDGVTINGGVVTAQKTGTEYGTAIDAGWGDLVVNDGKVTATISADQKGGHPVWTYHDIKIEISFISVLRLRQQYLRALFQPFMTKTVMRLLK